MKPVKQHERERARQAREEARAKCRAEGHDWQGKGVYSTCRRCGKTKRNSAPVKVQRVVPDTGEIIEQTVPQSRFKTKRQSLVTQDFRSKVLAGERPGLVFPGKEDCPLEIGQEIELTSNVSILVNRITKTKGGDHRCRYSVRDFRETLIRRTPPSAEPPETDAEGFPIAHTKEAIAAATIDGNYTQDPRQAIPSGAPEVDVEYRRVLGTRARANTAERKRKEQPMQEGEEDVQRLTSEMRELAKRATKMGIDPAIALAPVARQIKEAHAEMSEKKAAA